MNTLRFNVYCPVIMGTSPLQHFFLATN